MQSNISRAMVLECLHYNYNNSETTCLGTFEECAKQVVCSSIELGHHCFVVWQVGSPNPISAGCNPPYSSAPNERCSNECIGQQRGPRYYCCCTESLCNREYKLPPPPQASQRETIKVPENQTTYVLWYVITLVLFATLIGAFIYRYRRANGDQKNNDGKQNRRSNNDLDGGIVDSELDDFRNISNNRSIPLTAPFHNSFGNFIIKKFTNDNKNSINSGSNNSNNNNHHHHNETTVVVSHEHNLNNDHATTVPLMNHHLHHNNSQHSYNAPNDIDYHQDNSNHNNSNGVRIDLNKIKLLEVIGAGRFGTVHRASLNDTNIVAVKIISSHDHQSWSNEQQVYQSPCMKHPNVLNFYYSDENLETDAYWLIVEYASKGSLHSFLKDNTLSWEEFLHIALGVVHGLSHLHEAHIVHRDFKSKNVLLRQDLTPCITDFGVAAILDAPAGNQLDQRKKYLQVGTPRYMAPEVLECSVTFTKASFLKIDVYALSLVLWELISRCRCPISQRSLSSPPIHQVDKLSNQSPSLVSASQDEFRKQSMLDGSQSSEDAPLQFDTPPPYRLPFEDVAGSNPDIERMRQIVVVEKRRPPLRPTWHDYPAAEFCRAIEDGWEYDYDARISASCVVERIEILHQNS